MATRGLGSKWGGGGKIEGRHILIIAMSEHHVDYMNRKGGHSVIMQGGPFHQIEAHRPEIPVVLHSR